MARSAVPSEERLFSLVLALIANEHGLTKHDLLSSVYGYSDRYREPGALTALERQFERDKELLRDLGIPVATIESPGEPGNNQLTRYRIPRESFEVPAGLSFTERELMMLRLAALAWREGSLSVESRRAAMKLESLGAGIDAPALWVQPDFGASEPAAPALLSAIDAGAAVEFSYRRAGTDDPAPRRVIPLQLHRFERRWHLIAYDLERVAPRVFLLSRIEGGVTRSPRPGVLPSEVGSEALIAQVIDELETIQARQRVVIRVREGSTAEAQLAPRATEPGTHDAPHGFRVLSFGTVDYAELAGLLAGFGADAVVLAPEALGDRVAELLSGVRDRHGDARTEAGG